VLSRWTWHSRHPHGVRVALQEELIYRGLRIVQWCPQDAALSDLEVESPEDAPPGKLWHITYPVKGEPGRFLTVATTRPRRCSATRPWPSHPDDPRYKALIGKTVILPS
jgi:valyl-tRNA synthetase